MVLFARIYVTRPVSQSAQEPLSANRSRAPNCAIRANCNVGILSRGLSEHLPSGVAAPRARGRQERRAATRTSPVEGRALALKQPLTCVRLAFLACGTRVATR